MQRSAVSSSHYSDFNPKSSQALNKPECLYFLICVAGLADRERQAHLQIRPHRGMGDTPGFTHHSAIPPHTQPSGKSHCSLPVHYSEVFLFYFF